jgi:hypothetical protein
MPMINACQDPQVEKAVGFLKRCPGLSLHPPLSLLFARILLCVAVCSCHCLPCCEDITPSPPPPHKYTGQRTTTHMMDDNDMMTPPPRQLATTQTTTTHCDADNKVTPQPNLMQTTDNDTDGGTTTQTTGDDADNNNAP